MRQLKITASITSRNSNVTDKYLLEVSREEMITKEEEVELTKKAREGDKGAFDKMVRANLRFVISVAKQYQNRGLTLDDLINEGNLGLIKAVRRFDETRGFKFISFAVWWIRQSIMEAMANHSRMVRLPLNKVGILNKYANVSASMEQKLGRTPSVDEVMEAMDAGESEIASLRGHMFKHSSLDANIHEDDSPKMSDTMTGGTFENPDDVLMKESKSWDIERVLSKLTPIERNILKMHYGFNGEGMTLSDIAFRTKYTTERIRQIRERALKKLRLMGCRNPILKQHV